MALVSSTPTPWAVICPDHGKQYLTKNYYVRQLGYADAMWVCPLCGRVAEWDDDHYETWLE